MRIALVALAALSTTACIDIDFNNERYQADFHYTFQLNPGGRINVESLNGGIEIAGWDQNSVEISGVKYASTESGRDQLKIETHNTPDTIELRAVRPSGFNHGMGARFTIHVPRTAVLDRISTSNGSIRVRDVASAAKLATSNGSISAENVSGGLDAHTSNSAIEIDSVRGPLNLTTSNGRIRAENIEGPGDIGTSNSSIDLRFRRTPAGDVHAHTSNGSVSLRMPSGSEVRLQADTSNGHIASDFPVTNVNREEKNHLEGAIGGSGGPVVRLRTSNGNIDIQRGAGE